MSDSINYSGSMTDVPKNLLEQIKELERLFTVDQAKLKEITNHFVKELEKGLSEPKPRGDSKRNADITVGLSVEGGTIVSVYRASFG